MKKYPLKPSKKQLGIMSLYFKILEQEEIIFLNKVCYLERKMSKETGIEGLEFFRFDGEFIGVGNVSRTLKLIQADELKNE